MKLYNKLALIQASVGKLSKDLENPFFKSKYFDINKVLESLQPLCEEQNVIILQPIIDNCVVSRIVNLEDTKEIIDSSLCLNDITDPQKIGSAITYYRRYTLVSLLGLQAEDDDANKASGLGIPKKLDKKIGEIEPEKAWLNMNNKSGEETPQWRNIVDAINAGTLTTVKEVRDVYKVSKDIALEIEKLLK